MMRYPLRKILPAVGLSAAALAALAGPDLRSVAQAAPGPNEVLVVNPAGNPARTTIVGPVAATIANTAPIPVTIDGTASVALSGPVTIGNGEAQPVPFRDVAPRPVPWVGGGQVVINAGETFGSGQFFNVPPGHHLVIEAFSIEAGVPAGQVATQGGILATAAGVGEILRFPLPPMPDDDAAHDTFGTFQLTKINVRGSAGVIVFVSRDSTTGPALANVALSGYLIEDN